MAALFDKLKAELDRFAEGDNRFTLRNLACVSSCPSPSLHSALCVAACFPGKALSRVSGALAHRPPAGC